MLRRHGSLIIALVLGAVVAAACIVRTGPSRRSQPVYVQKHKGHDHRKVEHKKVKHKKHRDHR
jgi:hypothetical protein